MAQGIAMERYGIDAQQSFELLRRLSSTTNVKLRDVAAQIVETRTIPVESAREHADD
jgi:AmiR/NasT family two-component response regulator